MKRVVLLLLYAANVLSEIDRRDGIPNYFTNVNHGRLDYFAVLMFLEEITLDECIKHCMRHLRCRTVSYSSSARLCELNDMEFDKIEAVTEAIGWVNYGTPAKINGGYSDWANNMSCSRTCGEGHVTYYRSCDNPKPQHGGADCDGDEMKIEPCFLRRCPVHGGWGKWGASNKCDNTCGNGTKTWTRNCDNPLAAHGGSNCLSKSNEELVTETESRDCFIYCGPHTKVCYGAKDEKYGEFTVTKSGRTKAIRLTHISGYLYCDTPRYGGRWGCSWYAVSMMTYVTDENRNKIFPDTPNYQNMIENKININNADEIMLSVTSVMNVQEGQKFRIWYREDLNNQSEDDNSGEHCVYVDLIYEEE